MRDGSGPISCFDGGDGADKALRLVSHVERHIDGDLLTNGVQLRVERPGGGDRTSDALDVQPQRLECFLAGDVQGAVARTALQILDSKFPANRRLQRSRAASRQVVADADG